MDNPYRGYGSPVSGADFVGRSRVVEDISKVLAVGNVFLTGLHRIGKSSVAEEVLARLPFRDVKVCARPINLNTVKTEHDLFRMMLFALGSPMAKALDGEDDFVAFLTMQEALKGCLRERSSRIVMVIDEFDGILSFDNPVLTLNRLRDLAYNPKQYGVNFLFVSSRSLSSIEKKMAGSNLSGICKNVFLKPFDHEESAAMIARCGVVGDDGFVDAVYEQTGGVPYLMAALLSELCERSGGCLADRTAEERSELLGKCIGSVSRSFVEYYEKIRHSLSDEDNAWGELIGMLIGPVVKSGNSMLANLFQEYGIVSEDGRCASAHFVDYLEMCSRDIAPFETLRSVEVGLRKIVKEKLKDRFGESWADEIGRELPSVKAGVDHARATLEKEIRQFHLAGTSDLIEYTDLGDIKTIVTSKMFWPLFQQKIGMGVAEFTKHMDRILPMRNRTMHHRPGDLLPPEQVALARESCEALLKRIK